MKFLSKLVPVKNILKKDAKHRHYFDYASITPVDERVIRVMSDTMKTFSANPSSLYKEGVAAHKLMENCRKDIAKMLEVQADEIVFTSGGTEANNLAIKGMIEQAMADHASKFKTKDTKPHVVITAIEHPSILELIESLGKDAIDISIVGVQSNGIVDPKEIKKALTPETILVSVMYANNEIGTIQPIAEIAKVIRQYKKEQGKGSHEYPYLHTDACQAASYCSLRIPALNVDLLTLDASKIYGPRGVGLLYMKRGLDLKAQQLGGSQEKNLRAGTENLPAIVGFAKALDISENEKLEEVMRLSDMRDLLIKEIQKLNSNVILNGDPVKRLPNNINVCIPGSDAEFLVLKLDVRGIAVSSVTSCRMLSEDSASYVIEALGSSASDSIENLDCSTSSLRITLGRYTKKSDIKVLINALKEIIST